MKSLKLTKATEELRQQLSLWRETHRPPSPIPPELWEKAVELAEEQGLCKTARALRLDYGALKKRFIESRKLHGQQIATPPSFLKTCKFLVF
jgi:hypothetical protein